nr:hypothetical protein [Pedobacter panaciterrae]
MKALNEFTNVDKGRLIHQLFPNEMPAMIDFIKGMCVSIQSNEAESRKAFGESLFSFEFWLWLLRRVEIIIDAKKGLLLRSDKVFAEQLFEDYLACFTIHCILVYTDQFEHPDPKFTKAIDLLFK